MVDLQIVVCLWTFIFYMKVYRLFVFALILLFRSYDSYG